MVINKYGNDIPLGEYLKHLRNQIWKILPLKEAADKHSDISKYQKAQTDLQKYITSVVIELSGACELYGKTELISVLSSLEGLQYTTDYNVLRSKVLDCANVCENLRKTL